MGFAEARGWKPVSAWGKDGWDFLTWPYYMGYTRQIVDGGTVTYEFATDCEGDITVQQFDTAGEREAVMNELAFWSWKNRNESWVAGLERIEDNPNLMGPFSWKRLDDAGA